MARFKSCTINSPSALDHGAFLFKLLQPRERCSGGQACKAMPCRKVLGDAGTSELPSVRKLAQLHSAATRAVDSEVLSLRVLQMPADDGQVLAMPAWVNCFTADGVR